MKVNVKPGPRDGTLSIRCDPDGASGMKAKADIARAVDFIKSTFSGWDWHPLTQSWVVPVSPLNTASLQLMANVWEVVHEGNVVDQVEDDRRRRVRMRNLATAIEPPDWLKEEAESPEAKKTWAAPSAQGKKLMPHQICGAEAIASGRQILLNDATGAGKTATIVRGLMRAGPEAFPALIVAPASILGHWHSDILDWGGPDARPFIWWGKGPMLGKDGDATHVIVSYARFAKNHGHFSKLGFNSWILDEAHAVRERNTLRSSGVIRYSHVARPSWRIAATATPIVNKPADLVVPLEVTGIMQAEWGRTSAFTQRYVEPYTRVRSDGQRFVDNTGAHNVSEMRQRLLSAGMVQRTTADIMPWLPPARVIIDNIPMGVDGVGKHYKKALNKLARKILEGKEMQGVTYLDALREAIALDKVPAALNWLETVEEEEQKALVFAHHKSVLDAVHSKLGNRLVRVDGDSNPFDRPALVERFQTDKSVRFFLGSITASGEGLTLTKADKILFLQPGWNPMQFAQCIGRANARANEPKSVQAHISVGTGTVDEDILSIVLGKGKPIEDFMAGKTLALGGLPDSEGAAKALVLKALKRRLKEQGY